MYHIKINKKVCYQNRSHISMNLSHTEKQSNGVKKIFGPITTRHRVGGEVDPSTSFVSVRMTLSDLKRKDTRGQILGDLHNYVV